MPSLTPAVEAATPDEFAAADGEILREVVANDFPTRAKGLANEILRTRPDLVGLQEVALWRTGRERRRSRGPTATTVNYDYLELLLSSAEQGAGKAKPQYRVVVVQHGVRPRSARRR